MTQQLEALADSAQSLQQQKATDTKEITSLKEKLEKKQTASDRLAKTVQDLESALESNIQDTLKSQSENQQFQDLLEK